MFVTGSRRIGRMVVEPPRTPVCKRDGVARDAVVDAVAVDGAVVDTVVAAKVEVARTAAVVTPFTSKSAAGWRSPAIRIRRRSLRQHPVV